MSEIKVDISELKREDGDLIKELTEFLKEKVKAEVETTANELTAKSEEKAIPKKHLRVLLRKFLHQNELKDQFRVTSDKDTLTVRKRKIYEEE